MLLSYIKQSVTDTFNFSGVQKSHKKKANTFTGTWTCCLTSHLRLFCFHRETEAILRHCLHFISGPINHINDIVDARLIPINRTFLSTLNVSWFLFVPLFVSHFNALINMDRLALCKCFLLKTTLAYTVFNFTQFHHFGLVNGSIWQLFKSKLSIENLHFHFRVHHPLKN